jgi:hypothetical protein
LEVIRRMDSVTNSTNGTHSHQSSDERTKKKGMPQPASILLDGGRVLDKSRT